MYGVVSRLADVYTALHLDWPALSNARDLGGMPIGGGRATIAERAFVRTDSLAYLTEAGQQALRSYGISRIIDLRREIELREWPNPFAPDALFLNCPVENPEDDPTENTLAELYVGMLDRRPTLFAKAVSAIADAPPGGVVVHCAAGKDRTGIVVAMTLSLIGVGDDVIAADYALTDAQLRKRYDEIIASAASEEERAYWQSIRWAEPKNILGVLDHLRSRYGGVAEYLAQGGFTDTHIAALHDRLLKPYA